MKVLTPGQWTVLPGTAGQQGLRDQNLTVTEPSHAAGTVAQGSGVVGREWAMSSFLFWTKMGLFME